MKNLFLFLLLPFIAKSQQSQISAKYFNKINEVGKLTTNNSIVEIKQANQVLVRVDLSNRPKILLAEFAQYKQQDGTYLTGFLFKDTSALVTQLNLLFKFDKPIIGYNTKLLDSTGGGGMTQTFLPPDKTKFQIMGNSMIGEKGLVIYFVSQERIIATIDGLEGVIK